MTVRPDTEPAFSGMRSDSVMGRDAEVARLAGPARHAASGRGRLIVIESEPGIGKTALLRAVLDSFAELLGQTIRRLTGRQGSQ